MVNIPALSVISGKGGVGKTLISSSIVLSLAERGMRVGVIDADYSNPNLGRFLRVEGDIDVTDDRRIIPVRQGNISFFSIESVAGDRGVGMRGEDYALLTRDVLEYTEWDSDILVVDLPAAIGDEWRAVLSALDNYYLGSVIVAQPLHLETTERVIRLHKINGVPIIGIVENMVSFTCPHCGATYDLFGPSASGELAQKYDVPLLARVPIMLEIHDLIGAGKPVRLPNEAMDPIINAILAARPRQLGFMQELKERAKAITLDVVTRMLVSSLKAINSSINIGELKRQYNVPDDVTIALVLLNDDGEPMRGRGGEPLTYNFRVVADKLVLVENPKSVDATIMIKVRALANAILGEKKLPDGTTVPYSILDAYLNGDARLIGAGSIVRGLRFYKEMFERSRPQLTGILRPIVEVLA